MDFKNLYLNFNGRIRRLHYWIGAIVLGFGSGIVIGLIMTLFGGAGAMMGGGGGGGGGGGMAMVGLLICGVLYLGVIYASLALVIKRLHDRGRPAVFALLLLVPLINLWPTIEILFLDGTQGDNQYGPSPKGVAAPAAA